MLPTADQAKVRSGKTVTIFNIKNHFRLITAIHYNHQIVFILLMLSHSDYDKPHWKKNLWKQPPRCRSGSFRKPMIS